MVITRSIDKLCSQVVRNIYFGVQDRGLDVLGSQQDFFLSGFRSLVQTSYKLQSRPINLVIRLVIVAKEPFLTPQHLKGPVTVVG